VIDSLRQGFFPLLVLELGDFLEVDSRKAPLDNPLLVSTMERDGVAAVTPGPPEFDHWEEFEALMAGSSIKVVSTNVTVKGGDSPGADSLGLRPAAARSLVLEVSGVRVGLLGVLGAGAYAKIRAPSKATLVFQDPLEAIAEELPALREQAELIVVLACAGDEEAERIAEQARGVDVVLSGYESSASTFAYRAGEAIVNRSGSHGQNAGILRMILSPEGEILDWGGRNLSLPVAMPENSEVAAQVAALVERLAAQVPARREVPPAGPAVPSREAESGGEPPYADPR